MPATKAIVGTLVALLATGGAAQAAETRCGWLQNPTPANWWLDDSAGTWTLMTQGGGYEPEGFEQIPDISAGDYVRTNGNYGYACACMMVETDAGKAGLLPSAPSASCRSPNARTTRRCLRPTSTVRDARRHVLTRSDEAPISPRIEI